MKKILLALAFLALGAVPGRALVNNTVRVDNCVPVQISTSAPTEISTNTALPATSGGANVFALKVTNLDTANDIWCSQDSAVAISGTTHLGDTVTHHASGSQPNWLSWSIGPNQLWYCLAQTATVTVLICRTQ